jgi:oligopeptidase B
MPQNTRSLTPPTAATQAHTYSQHGENIEDPYAWLRDPHYPKVEDPEILAYLSAENDYFAAVMAPLQPLVDELFEEIKGRQPAEDECVPYNKQGYRYQWRFAADAQYRTWYRAPLHDPDAWQVILDEVALAEGHEYFSLGALAVSPCGSKLAYSIDTAGDERYTLQVVDIGSGATLTAPIGDTIGSPIWDAASESLLYVVVNKQWQPLRVYRRRLDDSDSADRLIFAEEDTGFRVSTDLSQSEQFVFISTGSHTTNEVWLLPRDNLLAEPLLMRPRSHDIEYHVDHGNGEFIIRSNLRQSNFDLYRTADTHPQAEHWIPVLQGSERHYLTGHMVLQDRVIVEERIDGLDQIRVLEGDDSHYIEFPEAAYDAGIGTNAEFHTDTLRLSYTSMVTPQTVYDYDLTGRTLTSRKVREIPSGYDASQFVTRRLQAPARDGAQVPISLVYHRDTPLDGSAPLYLYGYGAYGLGMAPSFSPARISLLERGFVYAIAHIRGGDELGYQWYTQGKLEQRMNTFNDFVDCANYLVEQRYSSRGRIVIAGGSAGGELMGAAVNQAPQLWGAVAAHVPFVDVLNTMLDATLPLTPPEWTEWGNPIEDAEAFRLIRSYSPYDQLKPGQYPPMLVTAGLNDPRVTYWEPAKYVAKLRTCKQDGNVLLLKTNMGAGHGGQSGRFDAIREIAEEYAFFINAVAIDPMAASQG